jgi:hypothetical protein
MTYLRYRARWVALILAVALLGHPESVAWAHGRTTVGDYELVIGFHNEPAYQSEPNGLDLFVTNTNTGEKVNGLEDTLKAELIYGSATKELPVEAQFGEDGAYTAHVQPTQAGDYTWHIFGMIEATPVDVSMTSGPDTFGAVEPKATVAFPAAEPTPTDLAQTSRTALLLGGAGTLLGLSGLLTGLLALRRRGRPAERQRGEAGTAHA